MTPRVSIDVRPLSADDLGEMERLLAEIRPSLGRMTRDSAYRALMAESLRNRGLWWLVAVHEETIVGFVVACRYGKTFWRRFLTRHPVLLSRLAVEEAIKRLREGLLRRSDGRVRGLAMSVGADETENRPRWSDNDASIAKSLYIHIAAPFRGCGAGSELNMALVDVLTRAGITRIDAHIDSGNEASIRVAQNTGWTLCPDSSGYLATAQLPSKGN